MNRMLPILKASARSARPKHVCRNSPRWPCSASTQLTQKPGVAAIHSTSRSSFRGSCVDLVEAAAASVSSPSKPSASSAGPADAASLASPRVATDVQSKSVYITWSSGITSKYHNIWLRDHCRCPHCYHPSTKQRLLNTFEIAPDTQPASIESTTEGLLVHWPLLPSELAQTSDKPTPSTSAASAAEADASSPASSDGISSTQTHPSLYPWRWLMNNSYSPVLSESGSATSESPGVKSIERVLWGKGIGSAPPTVKYEEVMQSEEGVLKWLTKVVSLANPSFNTTQEY